MGGSIEALSEREKQTLRFLLGGHDAKSIATELGLSVHTVNERLRDARRKMGVSSSREAARLLANAEQTDPNLLGDKRLGVGVADTDGRTVGPPIQRRSTGLPIVWLGGGMIIMSLVIAAAIVASGSYMNTAAEPQNVRPATAISPAIISAADSGARAWVALLDHQAWADSWAAAGTVFKSKLTQAQWVSTVQNVRQPLGTVSSRVLQGVVREESLPNVPPGEYAIVQYLTDFTRKPGSTETVILAHEGSGWKVDGYFIR